MTIHRLRRTKKHKEKIMEMLNNALEWAKADIVRDWEVGNTQTTFFVVLGVIVLYYAINWKNKSTEFMQGYQN